MNEVLDTQAPNTRVYFVVPRNISPWSSKATSIASVCGVKHLERIERGRAVVIKFSEPFEGSDAGFRDILYDRMTENLTTSEPDIRTMFAEGQRVPLEVIDIFAEGGNPLEILTEYNKERGLSLDRKSVV